MIRRECIEALREKIDICDVVSTYVTLRKCGAYLRSLSPFTEEKTPSFFIHPERNRFHCYSSGNSGDVFRFIQLMEKLSFGEAVEFLAEKYHFTLEYTSQKSGERGEKNTAEALLEIHRRVEAFFCESFFSVDDGGHRARLYWTKARHFSLESAERHGIGFATANYRAVGDKLAAQFGNNLLVESGLFLHSKRETGTIFPRFRSRLMIPIRDTHGRTIAFTGRDFEGAPAASTGQERAKYINSPETPIFHKSFTLFGIDRARREVSEKVPFLLVEGQIDCIRCFECGLGNAIASQGTSITQQHMHLLHRHALEIVCILDGDSAGQRAAVRLIPMALREGVNLRFVSLGRGEDPDSFLLKNGVEALKKLIEGAKPTAQVLVDFHMEETGESPAHRNDALRRIFSTIHEANSKVTEFEFLRQIAPLVGADMREIREDYGRLFGGKMREEHFFDPAAPTHHILNATEQLLFFLLCEEAWRPIIMQSIEDQWIDRATPEGKLLNHVIGELLNEKELESILMELPEDDQNFANRLIFIGKTSDDPLVSINACIESIYSAHIKRCLADINRSIQRADADLAPSLIQRRIAMKMALLSPPRIAMEMEAAATADHE
jgi:DNA primase